MELKNKKHERFCREYIIDHNATQAAIRAGYSKKTAKQIGQRLLTYVDVKARNEVLEKKNNDKLELKAATVLDEHMKRAFYDITDVLGGVKTFTIKGILKALKELPIEHRRLVKGLQKTKDGFKIEFVDKDSNLTALGKHLNIYTDTKKIKQEINLNTDDLDNMTDEELKAENEKLKKQLENAE